MNRILFVLGSLLLFTASCKKSEESQANKICFTRTLTELKIKNNTDHDIYFTAFGQNILPVIDWMPICGNNDLSANSSASRNLSTFSGYSNNDKLVIYWWECTGSNPGQVQNVILDKNQTECR